MKNAAILLLSGLIGLLTCAAHAADLAGQWRAEFDTQIGIQKYVFTFQADGDKLTGKAAAEVNGQKHETELKEVQVNGDAVSFVETANIQDNDVRIQYTGKIGTNEIAFTRVVGDYATEEFKATRVEQPAATTAAPTNLPPAAHAADLAGQWRAEFDTQIGIQKYVFTFQIDGDKLTGKAAAEVNGQKHETELKEVQVNGDTVSFVETANIQDNDVRIEYTGKIGTNGIAFTESG